MTVKESIIEEMFKISQDERTVFLGENVINSGRIYGTLDKVPINKCIEMPCAENLIAGTAVGLAINGYIPICIFQRMDFMYIAADAIINHAALLPEITGIKIPVIFRAIDCPLEDKFYTGLQHSKDLTPVFQEYIEVYKIPEILPIEQAYSLTTLDRPRLVVENRSAYDHSL